MGCTREESNSALQKSFDFTVNAALEDIDESSSTKATGEAVIRLKWSAGDKLSVINATKGKVLGGQLSAQSAGSIVPFTGTVTGTIAEGDKLLFLYPAMSNAEEQPFTSTDVDFSSQNKTIKICVYASQTASAESGEFTNISLSFKYLMGFVRANLTGLPINSSVTKFVFNNIPDILRISLSGEEFVTEPVSSAGNITYSASGLKTNSSGTVTLFLALPPTPAVSSRTVSAYIGPTIYTTSFTNTYIDKADNLNTRVSDFVKANVTFADAAVKSYCITNFDINSDGELSFTEAATPSDLGTATKASTTLPTTIKYFTELRFFTGLTSIPSFQNYTSLESIAIPAQITSIPDECFSGCTSLMNVIIMSSTPPTLGTDVFVNNYSSMKIYVPQDAVSTYKSAAGWSTYSSKIKDVTELGTGYGVGDWSNGGSISGTI